MEIRSFLAFDLPPDIKNEVKSIYTVLKKSGLEAAWVRPDTIHITLVFTGNVKEECIQNIISGIDSVTVFHGSIEISLSGMGVFPNTSRPRVLWLGLDGNIKGLAALKSDLESSLESFGIKREERPFRPHLTLGRFRKPLQNTPLLKRLTAEYKDISGPKGTVNDLVFYKSDLKPAGSVYTRIHSWPLINNQEGDILK